MTLYTRKNGSFIPLTKQQIQRMRRVDVVVRAEKKSAELARSTRALAAWLSGIQKRALRLDAMDLRVTRLPNVERLQILCDETDKALEELRKC